MRHSNRLLLVAALAAGLAASALPASAAFTTAELQCRSTVAKAGGALAKAALKIQTGCHKRRDLAASPANCNDIAAADTAMKFPTAEGKFTAAVAKFCSGTPASLLYAQCPSPCDVSVPSITTFAHVASCLDCLVQDHVESFGDDAFGLPTSPLATKSDLVCHAAITKNGAALFNSVLKAVGKCQATAEKGGAVTVDSCTETGFAALVAAARDKAAVAVSKACTAAMFPTSTLDPCGGSLTVFDLANCVADTARDRAQQAVTDLLNLPEDVVVPGSSTTTLPDTEPDPACPDVGELTLYSKMSNIPCTTNGDCTPPRFCSTASLRCETTADLDSGWTGLSHNADINDQITTRASLLCPGPASPGCGQCQVTGIDPSQGNCRCANNNQTKCDVPFGADAVNCGGGACDCYFGAPFPLNSAGTHVCLVNRFSEDITGTANVDEGSGEITAKLRTRVYLGLLDRQPCPVCGGKCSDTQAACLLDTDCASNNCVQDTPGDNVRGGLCVGQGTPNEGQACDVSSVNTSFPSRPGFGAGGGGGGYSLDCLPALGSNVSGSGLRITLAQTTGGQSLTSVLDCDGSGPLSDVCACKQCSKDSSQPCSSDAQCASQGGNCSAASKVGCTSNTDCQSANLGACDQAGNTRCRLDLNTMCSSNAECQGINVGTCSPSTCSSLGNSGVVPVPNSCTGGLCDDAGGGEGLCLTGPDDHFCDGLVRADGTGMKTCGANADCVGYGNCTLTSRRSCFLDPIVATGHADPDQPVAGAIFCAGSTGSGGINAVAGLPGPGRAISQGAARTFCASDHGVAYTPNVGGCPP